MRRAAVLLVALAALALPAIAAGAACPRTTLSDVEAEVMCPVCGTPLSIASESPQANRERALIQRMIDRCRTKDQIKDELVAEFGDDVLALPAAKGFNLSAYLIPALVVILAAGGIVVAARRWRRGGGRQPPSGESPDPAATKRLDADLERYEL